MQNKLRILYIEHEPLLGGRVKASLEHHDFIVFTVSSGSNVFDEFKNADPDICVFDITLPSASGYSIAKEIRQAYPYMPIIFAMTQIQTETQDLVQSFGPGVNDYISKPFSFEELTVRIHNLVLLTQQPRRTVPVRKSIPIGQYEFIPLRYELRLGDKVKKLSHREFILMQTLAENKNATVLRKELLMKLWGDDSFFNSRNLDVYIFKIRDYLKEDAAIEIITIKGIGYHFSVAQA